MSLRYNSRIEMGKKNPSKAKKEVNIENLIK